jgi:hypothetical protein
MRTTSPEGSRYVGVTELDRTLLRRTPTFLAAFFVTLFFAKLFRSISLVAGHHVSCHVPKQQGMRGDVRSRVTHRDLGTWIGMGQLEKSRWAWGFTTSEGDRSRTATGACGCGGRSKTLLDRHERSTPRRRLKTGSRDTDQCDRPCPRFFLDLLLGRFPVAGFGAVFEQAVVTVAWGWGDRRARPLTRRRWIPGQPGGQGAFTLESLGQEC